MKIQTLIIICLGAILLVIFAVPTQNGAALDIIQGVATAAVPADVYLPIVANQPAASSVPSLATASLYMTTLDPQTVYNEGCLVGQRDVTAPGVQDSVVVLDFGYPQKYADGTFGARGFAYPPVYANIDRIAATVENYGAGYLNCSVGEAGSHLRVAIGTSNWTGDAYPAVTADHGKAWALMVTKVNDWFTAQTQGTEFAGRIDAVGASDIELAWNGPTPTIAWLDGYASVTKFPLYNYGALEGCAYLAHPTYTCVWGNVEKAWYVVWGSSPVQPVPEIYATSGVNAEQWYLMSVYSYTNHQQKIQFVGPMTQWGACVQRGGCKYIDNKPEAAWWQLYNLLNGDLRTAGELLRFPTDIKYLGE